ncbi:MAG TPA: hypothetical protein VEV45_03385 [Streptosporangiaceae bacterium]|nr:hypothetical protein [Streptosporangiaceae bacterium]
MVGHELAVAIGQTRVFCGCIGNERCQHIAVHPGAAGDGNRNRSRLKPRRGRLQVGLGAANRCAHVHGNRGSAQSEAEREPEDLLIRRAHFVEDYLHKGCVTVFRAATGRGSSRLPG